MLALNFFRNADSVPNKRREDAGKTKSNNAINTQKILTLNFFRNASSVPKEKKRDAGKTKGNDAINIQKILTLNFSVMQTPYLIKKEKMQVRRKVIMQ